MLPRPATDDRMSGDPMLGDPGSRTAFWLRVLWSRCGSAVILCCALALMTSLGAKRFPLAIAFAASSGIQNLVLYRIVRRTGVMPRAVVVSDHVFAVFVAVALPAVFPWVMVLMAVTISLTVIGYPSSFSYRLVGACAGPFLFLCLRYQPEGWLPAYTIWLVCSTATVAIIGSVATEERSLRARYSQLIGQLDVIVWEAVHGQPVSYVNDAVTAMLGYTPQEWCAPGMWESIVHPDDAEVVARVSAGVTSGGDNEMEYRIRSRSGEYLWVLELIRVTRDAEGNPLAARGVLIDVSDRRNAEERAGQLTTLVRELPTSLQILRLTDPGDPGSLRYVAANRQATRDMRISEEGLIDMPSSTIVSQFTIGGLIEPIQRAIETKQTIEVDHLHVDGRGRDRQFRLQLVPLPEHAVGISAEDVTEKERVAMALRRQALYDPLTGLANRLLLHDRLLSALGGKGDATAPVALLMMDLNQFKEVNDALGHHHGDRLLVQLAQRLSELAGPDDTPARLGGDEFALVLPNATAAIALETAGRIARAFAEPVEIDGIPLQTNVSVGIACSPDHGAEPELLTRHADIAMYRAKSTGRGVALYEPELDHYSVQRLTLISDLRQAATRGQILAYYQPRIDLATGDVIDVEALIRWDHPTEGLLMPDVFIELAEVSGEIPRLTEEMLALSCAQIGSMHAGDRRIGAAVNLSVRNLYDPNLAAMIDDILQVSGFPSELLRLEITESELMDDPVLARKVLSPLRARGIRLSVDDFGTGYSSLSYLRSLPVDELKIDRSFVTDLERGDSTLVRSIIELGHNLGLQVVAEGVESGPVLRHLAELGCDSAQGYFVSHPLPADELRRFLARDGDHYRGWLRHVQRPRSAPEAPAVARAPVATPAGWEPSVTRR